MAAPSVFVSSTFYDLRYIRERISFFIQSLGYTPILSEEGAVFFDPRRKVAEACLAEIPNCQMFVLIIGGRYGSPMPGTDQSVTNTEFNEAVRQKLPIFALVEAGTHSDFRLFRANLGRPDFDAASILYPHSDDIRIFRFIESVEGQAVNNALVAFSSWGDIEQYLQQQWAGMMYSFLTAESQERRVADTLAAIADMNRRIEILSTSILASVGTEREKAIARIFMMMLHSQAVKDLQYIGLPTSPALVLMHETFDDYAKTGGLEWKVNPSEEVVISGTGRINSSRYEKSADDYLHLRRSISEAMSDARLTESDLFAWDTTEPTNGAA